MKTVLEFMLTQVVQTYAQFFCFMIIKIKNSIWGGANRLKDTTFENTQSFSDLKGKIESVRLILEEKNFFFNKFCQCYQWNKRNFIYAWVKFMVTTRLLTKFFVLSKEMYQNLVFKDFFSQRQPNWNLSHHGISKTWVK